MRNRPANLMEAFEVRLYNKRGAAPRGAARRPLVRLFRVPESALRELPIGQPGPYRDRVRNGERLVLWLEPNDIAYKTEATLVKAFHAVLKRLRSENRPTSLPTNEMFEVWRLNTVKGLSYPKVAACFEKAWKDCGDSESRERRAKRYVKDVSRFLVTRIGRKIRKDVWFKSRLKSGFLT